MLKKIEQNHVEVLQALIMSLGAKEWGMEPPASGDIEDIINTLDELVEGFHQRRRQAVDQARTDEERAVLRLQERIRLHTQVVRNWGYRSDVINISTELYAPLDERLSAAFGFSASDLLAVGGSVISLTERRLQHRFRKLRRIFRERNIRRVVKCYYAENPHLQGTPEEFLRSIPPGMPREGVAAALLSHSDLQLQEILTVDTGDAATASGLPVERVSLVLKALALEPGSLEGQNREYFFLNNPTWAAPLIGFGSAYFCPVPAGIFSHIHDIMAGLAERGGFKEALEDRRSGYLESKVAKLMAGALPKAAFVHGVKWKVGTVEYETDHVGKIDRTVFIIEDKSAPLSGAGLRGAPDRLKRHLQELVFDPSEQSARLEAVIWKAKEGNAAAKTQLAPFGFDFSDVEVIVRLSVTLYEFSALCSAEIELKEAGILPPGMQLAPTLSVADLGTVVDVLETPTVLVHYFVERARLQKALHVFADEIDFLGLYLETGFNIWRLEAEGVHIALTGMSRSVDRFYESRDAGVMLAKPGPKMSPYFARLLKRLEERGPASWLTVGIELLRACDFKEQRKVERMLERLRNNVRRNWRTQGHENSVVITPPEIRETAIAFYAFPTQLAPKRWNVAEGLAHHVLSETGQKRCIVISRNIDDWDQEYAAIYIFGTARHRMLQR